MSVCVMLVAGLLCGVSVFVVALPLAFSSPFPPPPQREWIIQASTRERTSSFEIARPAWASEPVGAQADLGLAVPASFAARWDLTTALAEEAPKTVPAKPVRVAALAVPSEPLGPTGAIEAARPKPIEVPAVAIPPKKRDPMEEVDQYLWEVYRRSPVKSDSSGDFSWKDPAAAKRRGISLQAFVIGGMDSDFREQLYHAGRAMDAVGIRWTMLSAFRDDYRQSLASGFKASARNSQHGGSAATGGYGHGRAIDITSAGGDAETVWRWIDSHGARYGLRRPMPGYDPAHIVPRSNWHELAASLRNGRARLADAARRPGEAKAKTAGASM